MKDKSFIDSNIFLYAFCTKDIAKQQVAKKIILSDCTISVQVINETSTNLLKKLNFDEDKVKKFIENCYIRYNIINFSKDIFLTASMIRKRYKYSYYDSLIISTALIGKCNTLFSEDMQHHQIIEDKLTIVNPFLEN